MPRPMKFSPTQVFALRADLGVEPGDPDAVVSASRLVTVAREQDVWPFQLAEALGLRLSGEVFIPKANDRAIAVWFLVSYFDGAQAPVRLNVPAHQDPGAWFDRVGRRQVERPPSSFEVVPLDGTPARRAQVVVWEAEREERLGRSPAISLERLAALGFPPRSWREDASHRWWAVSEEARRIRELGYTPRLRRRLGVLRLSPTARLTTPTLKEST